MICLILARGGSKGVPKKNIKILNGKPLIYYVIYEAKKSKKITKIYVSTDDDEIADIVKEYGVEVIKRPKQLSEDHSLDVDSFRHFCELKNQKDPIVHLRATTPLINHKVIDVAITTYNNTENITSLRSAHETPESVYKFYIKPNIKDINTISGSIILLVVFFVILFISLMGYFNIAIKNPDILGDNNTNKGFVGSMFSKMGYIIGAFFLLSVIFLLFNWLGSYVLGSSSDSETGKTTNTIVQIIISIIGLGILYKVLMRFDWFKRFLDKPIFGLLLNILFYIPCLLTNAYQSLLNEYNLADKTVISLIIIELLIIVAYFFAPQLIKKQYMKDGKQLLNEPIKLSSSKTVGELDELYDVTKGDSSTADQINYDYTYGLSFWTFIDSNPPSTNASFNSAANILSFSNNPAIKYNPTTNTLFITTKSDSDSTISIANNVTNLETNATNTNKVKELINNAKNMPINIELDENNDRIIYKDTNFLLQKWNNIVINYHGGTLDVFINGQLVKSSIEVAPYMAFNKITLGQENGLSGGIANVAFFKKPLDILTINTIYTSLKSMDPPVVK
jgi:GTP:adenosylcobinamide-phosphate guanylyltransferase